MSDLLHVAEVFRRVRFLAVMLTCLIGGLVFGTYRLVQFLQGRVAVSEMAISSLFFLIGLAMLVIYLRERRQRSLNSMEAAKR